MPPPDTIPRVPDSVDIRLRRPVNQLVDAVNSLLRSAELRRTAPNEWTVSSTSSPSGAAEVATYFPRWLLDPLADTGAANNFLAASTFHVGGHRVHFQGDSSAAAGLTIQYTGAEITQPFALLIENAVGDDRFSVTPTGALSAAAGAFTVDDTGLLDVAVGPAEFRTGANANVGVRILQNSSSQTGNTFEITTANGLTVLAAFNAACTVLTMPDQFAIGGSAKAAGTNAVAVGPFATASATNSAAFGNSSTASASGAVAIGPATASGQEAIAIGLFASATKSSAIAIGGSASCAQSASCAVGGGVAAGSGELAWGNVSSTAVNAHFRLTGNSDTQSRNQAGWRTAWIVSTDATHTVRTTHHVNDFNSLVNGREYLRADADGTDVFVGVGGAVSVARMTVNGTGLGVPTVRLLQAATNDDPNLDWIPNRATTTSATRATIETVAITINRTYLIEAYVTARRTGGTAGAADDGAVYIRRAMVTTKGGTVTINAVQDGLTQEDQAGWDVGINVSGATVIIEVQGAADNNVTWHSWTRVSYVGT